MSYKTGQFCNNNPNICWNAPRIESHPPPRQVYNPCYQPIPVSIGKVEQLLAPGLFCIATNLRTPYLHNQAPRGMEVGFLLVEVCIN